MTTVSPTYAQEICTPAGGHGLDVVLRARGDGVVGILNGVDYDEWNPATDRYLKHHYTLDDLSGKARDQARAARLAEPARAPHRRRCSASSRA